MSSDTPTPSPADPLCTSVATLRGVTPARLDQLARLGLRTVGDVLFHFPRAYEDLTDVRCVAPPAPNLWCKEGLASVEWRGARG